MASIFKFIVELTPPLNPRDVPTYCSKFSHLLRLTTSFGIVSHAVGNVAGFDRAYNLADYLLAQTPEVDLLFHLTCRDLNLVNVRTRLKLLRDLGIRKLLLVSGQNYQPPEKGSEVHFANSAELAAYIGRHYADWFDSIGIAGYPTDGTAGEEECERLRKKLASVVAAETIYTQCIFHQPDQFNHLRRNMKEFCWKVNVVPALPVFCDSGSLQKALRLTRGVTNCNPLPQLESASGELAKSLSMAHLEKLCLQVKDEEAPMFIYLCAFNRFELVEDFIERISRAAATEKPL